MSPFVGSSSGGWLQIASEVIGQEIVTAEREDTEDGRFFKISYDGRGYVALRPRELRNLHNFRRVFGLPHATAADKNRFLAALHNHADQKERSE